jgi:hypothetical protein
MLAPIMILLNETKSEIWIYQILYPFLVNFTTHIAIVSTIEILIYFWPFYLMGKNLEGVVD